MFDLREDPPEEFFEELAEYPRVIAKLLWHRGVRSKLEARRFLNPSKEDLLDPFLMRNMSEATKRTHVAIKKNEHILIVGDFDTDGISGAAVLARSIILAGGKRPTIRIPNHFVTGKRGLSLKVLEEAIEDKVQLLIAVDIGTNAVEALAMARSNNIDVIIIDHHRQTTDIPEGTLIINPQLSEATYAFPSLAACGLAFKFSQALLGKVDDTLLAYAAIATIADKVPLVGENRTISKLGRDAMVGSDSASIKALLQVCELHIGSMAERLNSSVNTDHKNSALELLIADDFELAKEFAFELNKEYWRRVEIIEIAMKVAEQIAKDQETNKMVIARDESFVPEIRGIVAGNLSRLVRKPTIVCSESNGYVRGSLRCDGEINLVELLSGCQELLESFGGHPNAAGFSVSSNTYDTFVQCVREQELTIRKQSRSEFEVDARLDHFNRKVLDYLEQLKPYGMKNPVPILLFVPE